ncbi:hypothetical protein BAE44_0000282 [Dichanthelium oligosanthes]|uniref:DUF6598 domain-containing protein n=1 Tax=Dichanthelium oligosanthes TaxID=888268 RepID=A0A1E5WMT7_9POAL|nr:hypothetical protein BAE44_0000282 [Dichanthelium oligosanthes]
MKIKTGEHEKDDLQLIDGISVIDIMDTRDRSVFTCRIIGDCGAIDISASSLEAAVEATVEIVISEVQGSFNMLLDCFTCELGSEPSGSSEYFCSFKARNHGHVNELLKTDFATISVKVTWSVLPCPWTTLKALLESHGYDK